MAGVELTMWVVAGYLGVGAAFAAAFLVAGARRVDPAVSGSSVGFYVMILPGTVTLWPVLALAWSRAARSGESR